MARFLHLADIHLGTHQYQNAERNRDFIRSLLAVIERHALPGDVDFVLIAGDLFDKRSIDALTLSHATAALKVLADRGIPVFGVEGNHDRAYYGEQSSWLEYLNSMGLLRLLRNDVADDGSILLRPWESGKPPGAYCDIGDIRIIGSRYYGASTPKAIEPMAAAIKELPAAPFTVLMWHMGVEGFVSALAGGVSVAQLEPLRQYTDYLALGHVHQRYDVDDWLYNPGPLEPCNITEASLPHGALMVTIGSTGHTVEPIEDYPRRSFIRVSLDLTPFDAPTDLQDTLPDYLERHLGREFALAPIVELTLAGTCRFSRSSLDMDWIRQAIVTTCAPLVVLLRNVSSDGKLAVAPDSQHHLDRQDLERLILQDCFAQDARYRPMADQCGQLLLELKNRLENGEKPPSLVKFLKETVPLALQPKPMAEAVPAMGEAAAEVAEPQPEVVPGTAVEAEPSAETESAERAEAAALSADDAEAQVEVEARVEPVSAADQAVETIPAADLSDPAAPDSGQLTLF